MANHEDGISISDTGVIKLSYMAILISTVPMVAICAVTMSANAVILAMFYKRRGLRRIKNLYFASLAVADFLVGSTMPYRMARDLHQSWDSGWACKIYQTISQAFEYASFLSIFLITLDKWRATHYPVSYRSKSKQLTSIVSVVIIWTVSLLIFTAPHMWFLAVSSSSEEELLSQKNEHQPKDKTANDHSTKGRFYPPHDFCPEPYQISTGLYIFSSMVYFAAPLLVMFVFDVSLYLKIKWRKKVEVQRSTSVTDTYFMTLKKSPLELPESCVGVCGDEDGAKESLLKFAECKPFNKHLAIEGRGERRHSSLPAISPIIGRTSSGRRVSMPEGNDSKDGCRYVGRKWSGSSTALGNNQQSNMPLRLPNDGVVHDILVKQDKKTVRCLCLLLSIMLVCWLPRAITGLVQVDCWCVPRASITATSWFALISHLINPFIYGLMNAQFKNVLKQWLLWEQMHAYRRRDTLPLNPIGDEKEEVNSPQNLHTKKRSPNLPKQINDADIPRLKVDIGMQCLETDFSRV
ncbi:octopamine receptor [Plakobranchus ocellatus]|uniref:Octopamine receptor n=1 Tax=Plakobranchus ocellatus TaxID=259542 RepID=A0AAV4DS19_9GAST|nr:octopamine receptor [Plakobranchus ocellatus]